MKTHFVGLKTVGSILLLAIATAVFGGRAQAQTANYWHTNGSQIVDANGSEVRIAGVNWYGFEGSNEVAQGLWSQDYRSILNSVKNNGYNTIRVPFSNQMVESPISPPNIQYSNSSGAINTDLKGLNSLQILDKIVAYAGQLGLHIILDNHRSSAGNGGTESDLWYTSAFPESAWIKDWQTLAGRYLGNSTVIGFDLRNEPHGANSGGACWGCGDVARDWQLAAQRAGDAVQSINPNLLIFVEGTDCYNGDCGWWGGNLEGAQAHPVVLNTPNHVVYSAHDYGPNLSGQPWFSGNTTANSLNATFTRFWGYLAVDGIAPVWVGEFGTTNNNSDIENSAAGSQGQWFQTLVAFLSSNPQMGWTYWALDGEDAYGLLDANYDPTPANALKQQLLASIQSPVSGGGVPNPPPSLPQAPVGLSATAVSSTQINLTWSASATAGATYNVYESTASNFSRSTSTRIATGIAVTSFQQQSLAPATTYYYLVTAVTSAGESSPSNYANAITAASSGPLSGTGNCQVTYTNTNDWGSGFGTSISIANTGTSAVNGWTLTWTWAGNQQITQAWNSSASQNGPAVTLKNASWNAAIAPGASVTGIGFNASYTGANVAPRTFYLNGAVCGASGSSSGGNVPTAPANLAANAVSSSQINLNWPASAITGVTYDVYASTSTVSATPALRIASGLTGTNFSHTGVAAGTTYNYVVTALDSSGESAPSPEASATTQSVAPLLPMAPTGLLAAAASSTQINLSWTASATPGAAYDIYANTSPAFSPSNRIATGVSATTFQHVGLKSSQTYYYVVTAVNPAGESGDSNQANATTPAAVAGNSSCHVSYTDQNDWGSGMTAGLSITNTGGSLLPNWTLTWTWAGNQQITNAWNAGATQTGNRVSLSGLSYNSAISPGATITGIGFNANYSGVNAAPSAFYVNGALCK